MTKVLLVEDDKSLREIYAVRLVAEGYDIVSAGDGEEALAMAIKERPGLIISDVMMPKISGFDMLDILRSTTETKNIKVIMMTALSSEDQRTRGEQLGADKYLVKSQVGIEDVIRAVHDVLGDAPTAGATSSSTPATPPAPAAPSAPRSTAPAVTAPPRPEAAPAAPTPQPAPAFTPPAPAAAPAPNPTPVAAPAPVVEDNLPKPTAPLTPAGSASRVINPISSDLGEDAKAPLADLMDQELSGEALAPAPSPMPTPAATSSTTPVPSMQTGAIPTDTPVIAPAPAGPQPANQ